MESIFISETWFVLKCTRKITEAVMGVVTFAGMIFQQFSRSMD